MPLVREIVKYLSFLNYLKASAVRQVISLIARLGYKINGF